MHSENIRRLVDDTRSKIDEAREILLQSPDQIGTLSSADLVIVIDMAAAALNADTLSLRGDIGAAHRRIRRCRFPREESIRLFSVFADIAYALEDIERAAAVAQYPMSEAHESLPTYFLVEKEKLLKQLDALESRLSELDIKLEGLDASKARTFDFARQDALIDIANRRASARSKMVHQISTEQHVDIGSLYHSIQMLDRIVEAFSETISAPGARVTPLVKENTKSLRKASRRVVAAGNNTRRVAIAELNQQVHKDPLFEEVQPEDTFANSAAAIETAYTYIRGQSHLLHVLQNRGNLRDCDLAGVRVHGIDLSNRDLSGSNWMASVIEDVNLSGANLKGVNFERAALSSVNMTGANLWGVNFWMARLRDTDVGLAVLDHTNFWNTEGVPSALADSTRLGIISFGDYGTFFDYFTRDVGMSKREIGHTFAWLRSDHFSNMLWQYYD